MTCINVHEAKTNLSRILAEVEEGASVVIARNGKPIAEIIPYSRSAMPVPGLWRGKVRIAPDFDAEDPELTRLFQGGSD